MTNKQAINILLNEQKCIDRNDSVQCDRKCGSCDLVMDVETIREAYSMAVSALQAQDVPDTNVGSMISRQWMIDELKRYFHDEYYQRTSIQNCIDCFIEDILTKSPPAQPEQRWIPCSETIDIPDHEVLCCDRHGEELIGWLLYIDDQWLCESDGEMTYNPVAWREKPEPYREEGEQDDSN